jgi:hypothetical protein
VFANTARHAVAWEVQGEACRMMNTSKDKTKTVSGNQKIPQYVQSAQRAFAAYEQPQGQHSPLPETTGLPWIVETRQDTKYPDITLAQVIAPHGYTDSEGNTHRCVVTDWLDSPADAKLIVASVNHAQALVEALRWAKDYIPAADINCRKVAESALAAWEGAK